ncbi:MAG TPA: MOSC domain-containing protein [Vicinamibacterales bacterium]|nr:MOSC domain-containing protein [Vicinamibacterales bacterium]
MRLLSVNVGQPREFPWQGRTVVTSIFKSPIEGAVRVSGTNVEGDEQSDLTVHGGHRKAVYAYPSEHYAFWKRELGVDTLMWGAFGENLTIEGLLEGGVRVGDRFRIGSVELEVTQPRSPCFKLGVRFGRLDMVKRFLQSGRSGFYLSIIQDGSLQAGDRIELVSRLSKSDTIAEQFQEVLRRNAASA